MEPQKKKCSLSRHSEVDAVSYCQDCKSYFYNKMSKSSFRDIRKTPNNQLE